MKAVKLRSLPRFDLAAIQEDFRDLDPKDPGRWPLLPRVITLLGLFAALLAAGWWFDWSAQQEELEQKRAQETKLREEWVEKKKQATNLDAHRQQLAEIDRQFGAVLRQLPNKAEMEAVLVDINQAGLGRGLQFDLFKPGQEAVREFYAELPISLRVTGSYHDFGFFAGDLAKLPRIVSLGDMVVENLADGRLKLDAVATIYRYLDDQELARQKKDKAGKNAPK